MSGTARAPFQVLVLPFRRSPSGEILYALFRREDSGYWQGVAGGGEDGETPMEAARREVREEAGLADVQLWKLDSMSMIPVVAVTGELSWGPEVLVIPEYAFAAAAPSPDLSLSDEHTELEWFTFAEAEQNVKWDSNRTALWELNHRLAHQQLPGPHRLPSTARTVNR